MYFMIFAIFYVGRIINTTSSSGLYGNYGQANYASAKMGVVGLALTLAKEGKSKGVHVNVLAPQAGAFVGSMHSQAQMNAFSANRNGIRFILMYLIADDKNYWYMCMLKLPSSPTTIHLSCCC